MYVDFNLILIPLSAALGLSLTVERILEFVSNLWERLLGLQRTRKIPVINEKTSLVNNLEKIYLRSETDLEKEQDAEKNDRKRTALLGQLRPEKNSSVISQLKAELKTLEFDTAWDEEVDTTITLVEPANDPDDGKTLKRFILQIFGFALGILLVHYSGVQIFSNFLHALQLNVSMPAWLDFLFTGLLIGGGSAPMHTIVRFVTTQKITFVKESDSEEKKYKPEDSGFSGAVLLKHINDPALKTWMDIPYFGGVDRQLLEGIHRRESDPDMIIYHHTGMHSNSTFEDIVRAIKSQTDSKGNHWLTAYNCVILIDGTVRPFCRWDRYGNHAAGLNRRSLGIAFNGNFETNPKTPFSNPNGQKGVLTPSEVQLKAGAKVVALWLNLYEGIQCDFQKNIIAHNQIAAKMCPGDRFPYKRFEDLVHFYVETWKNSDIIQQRVAEYKFKAYLYV